MVSNDDSRSVRAGSRLDKVIADYVRASEEGKPLDREQLLAQHADLAVDLREFFRHHDQMGELLDPLRSVATRVLNLRCPHCHNAIELLDKAKISSISCPSCGSNFSLVGTTSTGASPGAAKLVGQFQLLEQIGVGQFGCVWKARDRTLDRAVAIKIPRRGRLNELETEMFLRDARLAAQLKHPNIVSVHEVGKHDNTIYIVSDYIEGATLMEWIATKRLTPHESAEFCVKVACALHHAHEAGVIHRDLKPGNIMVTPSPGEETGIDPHIVDFGLAKRDSGEITMTVEGQILGTPAYMSPEQARGEGHTVDRRADIYSLGVIFFELLTAEIPFRGEKQMLIVQILHDDPPSPRKLNNIVPRDLETICLKCLHKEPSRRYPTAAAFADDLRRWLDRKPIVARPVGRSEKLWLWCRRRPAISSLLALLVMVVLSAVLISREVRRRERVHATVQTLLRVRSDDVLDVIHNARSLDAYVQPKLKELMRKDLSDKQRLNVALARFQNDGSQLHFLRNTLLSADPRDLLVIRSSMAEFADADSLSDCANRYWQVAANIDEPADKRLRAAGALAEFTAADSRWNDVAVEVVAQLVSQPIATVPDWLAVFRPVSPVLKAPLKSVFEDPQSDSERAVATTALANYLSDDPSQIVETIKKAAAKQLFELVPKLQAHPHGVSMLKEQLASSLVDNEDSETTQMDFVDPPNSIVDIIESAAGLIDREFALCAALPFDDVVLLLEQLREFGYRPIRCRPFTEGKALFAAVLWNRDGRDWRVQVNLSADDVRQQTQRLADEKLLPIDVAGYMHDGQWKCAAVWGASEQAGQEVRLWLLEPRERWQSDFDGTRAAGFVPQTIQIAAAPDYEQRRSQVWLKPGLRSFRRQNSRLKDKPPGKGTDRSGALLVDLSVYPNESEAMRYGSIWHREFRFAYRVLQEPINVIRTKFQNLAASGYRPASVCAAQIQPNERAVAVSVWHQPLDRLKASVSHCQSQANMAIALSMLGDSQAITQLLRQSSDPQLRSHLIQRIGPTRLDPSYLIAILADQQVGADVRQALILSLANYGQILSPFQRQRLVPTLSEILRNDPNSGVHGAAEWLLRHWDVGTEISFSDFRNSTDQPGEWYLDRAGNTMVVAKLPPQMPVRLMQRVIESDDVGQVFAISSKEITVEQYQRFQPDHTFNRNVSPTKDCPANNLSWYDAVAYCHWLNELHDIPRSEWCYFPNANGEFADGMRIAAEFATRKGYRLSTPVEFRYAACAMAETDFCFGDDSDLLSKYAWCAHNSPTRSHPVGTLLPNVFGLFDVHGNVMEWCHGVADNEADDNSFVIGGRDRAIVGGHFRQPAFQLGYHLAQHGVQGNLRREVHGLRVVRTIVPVGNSLAPEIHAAQQWDQALWLGRHGRWREAAELMQDTIPEFADSPRRWHILHLVFHFLGEMEQVHVACDEMFRRFGDTNDPEVAHHLAYTSLVVPNRVVTRQLHRIAELSVTRRNPTHYRDMGILHFRRGEWAQAEQWLIKAKNCYLLGKPNTLYFLAMTRQRRGDEAGAQQALQEAEAYREQIKASIFDSDYGEKWYLWLGIEAVRREAEQTLSAK